MSDENKIAESGLRYGFAAGWAAACHAVAAEMHKVGPGETTEEASARMDRDKGGDA